MIDKKILSSVGQVMKRFALKGVLVAVLIIGLALLLNSVHISIWVMNHDAPYSQFQWAALVFLGGIFPIWGYVVLGIFRSIKVLYLEVYQSFVQPYIQSNVEKYVIHSSQNFLQDFRKELSDNLLVGLYEMIDTKLTVVPGWARKIVRWMLRRVNLELKLYDFIQKHKDLSEKEIAALIAAWFDERLSGLVDDIKPFWLSLIIPIHVVLSVALWFVK